MIFNELRDFPILIKFIRITYKYKFNIIKRIAAILIEFIRLHKNISTKNETQ